MFDRATGALSAVAPNPDTEFGYGMVSDLDVAGNILYVAGDFTTISGVTRHGAAAIDLASGEMLPWAPLGGAADVRALAVSGDHVFLAGQSQPDSRAFVTKVHAVSAAPALDWQVRFGNQVRDIAVEGPRVAFGGMFASHNAIEVPGFVAINLASGTLADTPRPNGLVRAMAMSESTLYLGGRFSAIDGQARQSLAALDTSTGTLLPFAPNVADGVYGLAIAGSDLYTAGNGAINGQPRSSLGAVNRLTGELRPFNPPTVYRPQPPIPPPVLFVTLAVGGGHVRAAGYQGLRQIRRDERRARDDQSAGPRRRRGRADAGGRRQNLRRRGLGHHRRQGPPWARPPRRRDRRARRMVGSPTSRAMARSRYGTASCSRPVSLPGSRGSSPRTPRRARSCHGSSGRQRCRAPSTTSQVA